jgi:hypothetical protein
MRFFRHLWLNKRMDSAVWHGGMMVFVANGAATAVMVERLVYP